MNVRQYTQYAWGVVVFNLLVILWGAVVRITGSGAGCGSHWPLCNGEVVPLAGASKTLIEFGHRATSGLALLAVFALVVFARRLFPAGHLARRGAYLSLFFILVEAALGAGLVIFGLVEDNASAARAVVIAVHLVNTFILLACLALAAWWAENDQPFQLRGRGKLPIALATALVAVMLVGATGAVTALGDTLFPAESLAAGIAQDFAPDAHPLVQLRILHPAIAIVVAMGLILLASSLRTQGPEAQRWADRLFILVFVQVLAGAINFLLMAPIWMQLIHLLLADLLWLSLVLAGATALAAPDKTASDVESDKAVTGEPIPA